MPKEKKEQSGGKRYTMGNVGDDSQVIQGDHNRMIIEIMKDVSINEQLKTQFEDFMNTIDQDENLDSDEKELLIKKTQKVAESLTKAEEKPEEIPKALESAKNWFGNTASWAWDSLKNILNGEEAKKILKNVKDTGVLNLIAALLR